MTASPIEFWHFGRPAVAGMEEMATRCESLGFDGMTLTDSQNLASDTYVALTLAARTTSTLLLGTGVTNPLTRHAAVTAGAMASIQEVSGVGIFAHFTSMPGATRDRVADRDQKVFDRIGDYDQAHHGQGNAGHAKALPVEFISRFAIIGPAQHFIEKLAKLRALGIDRFFVIGPRADHFGDEADAAQARFAQQVIPALR